MHLCKDIYYMLVSLQSVKENWILISLSFSNFITYNIRFTIRELLQSVLIIIKAFHLFKFWIHGW